MWQICLFSFAGRKITQECANNWIGLTRGITTAVFQLVKSPTMLSIRANIENIQLNINNNAEFVTVSSNIPERKNNTSDKTNHIFATSPTEESWVGHLTDGSIDQTTE